MFSLTTFLFVKIGKNVYMNKILNIILLLVKKFPVNRKLIEIGSRYDTNLDAYRALQ